MPLGNLLRYQFGRLCYSTNSIVRANKFREQHAAFKRDFSLYCILVNFEVSNPLDRVEICLVAGRDRPVTSPLAARRRQSLRGWDYKSEIVESESALV